MTEPCETCVTGDPCACYDDGHQDGYNAGHADGLIEGHAEVRVDGD